MERLADTDTGSSSEDNEVVQNHSGRRKALWRPVLAVAGIIAATATVGTLYRSGLQVHPGFVRSGIVGLSDKDTSDKEKKDGSDENDDTEKPKGEAQDKKELDDVCEHLPFVRLMKIKSSNLGNFGPDKKAEEGIIYTANAYHMFGEKGSMIESDLEVHVHALTVYGIKQAHGQKEGEEFEARPLKEGEEDPDYSVAWPKENGINGHFGSINLRPGTNVTVLMHLYNTSSKEDIRMPSFALTFFDLDTGRDNVNSVEFVKTGGFTNYYLTNTTQIKVSQTADDIDPKKFNVSKDIIEEPLPQYTFTASKEGNGDDNPTNPLQETIEQKNKMVSFHYSDVDKVIFQIGASEGQTVRVFDFAFRPALRCAWTINADGTLQPFDSASEPFEVDGFGQKAGAVGAGPAVAYVAAVFLGIFGHFM